MPWRFAPPATWKRVGRQHEGPCPVTGAGKNTCHVIAEDELIGCRKCGDGGGRLDGDLLTAHLDALGIDRAKPPVPGRWESWTWTTADGKTRDMVRLDGGRKTWRKPKPGDPKPGELLFDPVPYREASVIVLAEGPTSTLALTARGLTAIGFPGAKPTRESLKRLPVGAKLVVWPDHDASGDGVKQARRLCAALGEAARDDVLMVDPLKLNPDAPDKWDARDWKPVDGDHDPLDAILDAAAPVVPEDGNALPLTEGLAAWLVRVQVPPAAELAPDAPGLFYARRAVLAHAIRGQGKSTYAAWAVSRATAAGPVLMLVDDDPTTWADRLVQWPPARPENIRVGTMDRLSEAGALEAEAEGCVAVVIDSWRRWFVACGGARKGKGAMNDETTAGPIMDRLVNVARTGPAMLVLGNGTKDRDNDTMRGSFSTEDSVDAVRKVVKADGVTVIKEGGKTRHGIPEGPWRMRLTDREFFPVDSRLEDPPPGNDPLGPLSDFARRYLDANENPTVRGFRTAARDAGHHGGNGDFDTAFRAARNERAKRAVPLPLGTLGTPAPESVPESVPTPVPIDLARLAHPPVPSVPNPIDGTPVRHAPGSVPESVPYGGDGTSAPKGADPLTRVGEPVTVNGVEARAVAIVDEAPPAGPRDPNRVITAGPVRGGREWRVKVPVAALAGRPHLVTQCAECGDRVLPFAPDTPADNIRPWQAFGICAGCYRKSEFHNLPAADRLEERAS